MKNQTTYKYINLLLRICIGIGALWFIYNKVNTHLPMFVDELNIRSFRFSFLIGASCLLVINWGIEAYKWQFLIRNSVTVSWFRAFRIVLSGITMGLITPNRLGEIPARALLLNNQGQLKDVMVQTSVGAYSQLIITCLMGAIGLVSTMGYFNWEVSTCYIYCGLALMILMLLTTYFFHRKVTDMLYKVPYLKKKAVFDGLAQFKSDRLFVILALSALRYGVFFLQFYLVLSAFNVVFDSFIELMLIPVCFLIASIIPTIVLSEIAIRGSVALFVFGVISELDTQLVMASIFLWLINVAVPALWGVVYLKELKIINRN